MRFKYVSDKTERLCCLTWVIECTNICHLSHPGSLALAEYETDFTFFSFAILQKLKCNFPPDNSLSCLSPDKCSQETNSFRGPVLWNFHKDVSHCSGLGENPAISHSPCSFLVKQIQIKSMVKHLLEFYPATLMEPGCQPLNFGTLQ